MSPTITTKKAAQPKRIKKSRQAMERENVIFLGVAIGGAVTLVIHLILQISGSIAAGEDRAQKLQAIKSERILVLTEGDENFTTELEIAVRARGENLAAKNREEEFEKRLAFDPGYAQSKHEKAMLEMKRIGADEELDREEALKKIAKLASPSRSGVGIFKTKGKLKIEVAISYEQVIKDHPEVQNYAPGVYREVRMTAAGIVRDIFAFRGHHGVSEVVVSCQKMVNVRSKGSMKKELRELFVISATPGSRDWSRMSRTDTEDVWKKKRDLFPSMLKEGAR